MHKKYGNLDLEEILKVLKIMLVMDFQFMKLKLNHGKEKKFLIKNKNSKNLFLKNNKSYKFGEILKNIPLANTLKKLVKKILMVFIIVK